MIRNDTPISERYRMAALDWVAMDAAARMLDEGKTTYLAQLKAKLGDMLGRQG
jgi:triphosphoribosyl-dephospho-CoA synthetase